MVGLAVGTFGECSDDVLDIITKAASKEGQARFKSMGSHNPKQAARVLLQQKKGIVGIAATRSQAAAKLHRLARLTSRNPQARENDAVISRESSRINQLTRELWYANRSGWGQHCAPRAILAN